MLGLVLDTIARNSIEYDIDRNVIIPNEILIFVPVATKIMGVRALLALIVKADVIQGNRLINVRRRRRSLRAGVKP